MWQFVTTHGFWICVVGFPMIAWIATDALRHWRNVRISEHLTSLKQSMIERGMSADEIERVLHAGTDQVQMEEG